MDNYITIKLEFDKAATRLAGNSYGKSEFEKQVKDKINYEVLNIIIFPDQIEKIASSFTQGFFAEVIEKIGYARFNEVIKIEAKDEKLANTIYSDLLA